MQNELQLPIVIQVAPRKKIGFLKRAKEDRAKLQKARNVLHFAQDLQIAGVSEHAKARSIIKQYGLTTREARLCVKLVKPKKHRRRA